MKKANPAFWKGRPVCVTGGTGFLGYQLVLRLLDLGAQVRVLALRPRREHPLSDEPRVECVYGDVRDSAMVRRAVAGVAVVFHTAGVVSAWGPALALMHSVHIEGTRNVIAAIKGAARIVHTSSIVAVGASRRERVLDEESTFNLAKLQIDYVHAKRGAEQVALAADRDVVVVNPGYLVGPDDYERSVMGRLCVRFWKGRVPASPPGGLNLVDVRDVADGHLLAAEHGLSGRRYILGGENRSCRSFLDMLARTADFRPRLLVPVPARLLAAVAHVAAWRAWLADKEPYPAPQHVRLNRYSWFVTSRRAEQELGYQARPLTDSLRDTHEWYGRRGDLHLRGLCRWWMRPGSGRRAA